MIHQDQGMAERAAEFCYRFGAGPDCCATTMAGPPNKPAWRRAVSLTPSSNCRANPWVSSRVAPVMPKKRGRFGGRFRDRAEKSSRRTELWEFQGLSRRRGCRPPQLLADAATRSINRTRLPWSRLPLGVNGVTSSMSNPSGNGGIVPSAVMLASITGKPVSFLTIIRTVKVFTDSLVKERYILSRFQ